MSVYCPKHPNVRLATVVNEHGGTAPRCPECFAIEQDEARRLYTTVLKELHDLRPTSAMFLPVGMVTKRIRHYEDLMRGLER